MGTHAVLSASGAKRWLKCPGSIELTSRLPESWRGGSSEAARLGTAAHALAEHCLTRGMASARPMIGAKVCLSAQEDAYLVERLHAGAVGGPNCYEVDDDMADAVDVYLDTVWGDLASTPGAELMVERRFDLSWLRPNMFGTGDAVIYQFMGLLRVTDYKHGQGVRVEVEENEQEMYYGLGLANEVDWLFEELELVIVQPRHAHPDGPVRRWRCSKERLREFEAELAAGADRVEVARADPHSHLHAGDHCGFCPMLGVPCAEALRLANEVAGADFADDPFALEEPSEADPERLANLLLWTPFIDRLLRSAGALAQRLVERGEEVPHHKLVRKKANRAYCIPKDEVAERLSALGLEPSAFMTDPKLKSPAQVEKLGKEAKALVQGVWDKKAEVWIVEPIAKKGVGGLTLAHESDPRPAEAFDPAADFADDISDEGDE